MADSIQVTPSGTVGKQVYSTSQQIKLRGFLLSPGAASAVSVVIRDGNASGTIKFDLNTVKAVPFSQDVGYLRFDKGMHVKVIGTGGACFLLVD